MACCVSSVTWECCNPDPCNCDTCCCQDVNCQQQCNDLNSTCGFGACCTCDTNNWGFAWKTACPCGICPGCGVFLYFNLQSQSCTSLWASPRVDTHKADAASIADFTKPFFMQFAPLSQGVISGMRVSDDGTCC
jgi:hypothetical protein